MMMIFGTNMTLDQVLSGNSEIAANARYAISCGALYVCPACGGGHRKPGRCRNLACFAGPSELVRTHVAAPPERRGWGFSSHLAPRDEAE